MPDVDQPHAVATGTVAEPSSDALITDLVAHWTALDPPGKTAFADRETWELRLDRFGYLQLFTDWWTAVGEPRATNRQLGDSDHA